MMASLYHCGSSTYAIVSPCAFATACMSVTACSISESLWRHLSCVHCSHAPDCERQFIRIEIPVVRFITPVETLFAHQLVNDKFGSGGKSQAFHRKRQNGLPALMRVQADGNQQVVVHGGSRFAEIQYLVVTAFVELDAHVSVQRRIGAPDSVQLRDHIDDIAGRFPVAVLYFVFFRTPVFLPARDCIGLAQFKTAVYAPHSRQSGCQGRTDDAAGPS